MECLLDGICVFLLLARYGRAPPSLGRADVKMKQRHRMLNWVFFWEGMMGWGNEENRSSE